VELVRAGRFYADVAAVREVSLRVQQTEIVNQLGSSGSGKTTTLMMVAGFVKPSGGDIFIDGRRVNGLAPHRRNLGVVFQHYALFPHMTIAENLAFPLRTRGLSSREVALRVDAALAMVNLSSLGGRRPAELSGGQQQRVALARALIFRPRVLLMDEPLGALDRKLRLQLQLEIKQIQVEQKVSVIYVTHDQEEALTMSDRIAVMADGMIAQIDVPRMIYERPANEFVASFIGDTNLFRVSETQGSGEARRGLTETGIVLPLGASVAPETKSVVLAIRPERIRVEPWSEADAGRRIRARVSNVIYSGDAERLVLEANGQRIVARLMLNEFPEQVRPGDEVAVSWDEKDAWSISS
jgi:putative spermidine/putrescine transport system ATP-binding protein